MFSWFWPSFLQFWLNLARDVLPCVKTVMEPPRLAVMTVAETPVELAPSVKNVAEDNVSAPLTVQEEAVEMMAAAEIPVAFVLPHKHAPTDNVLELQLQIVLVESVDPTVLEEVVVAANLDKDAVQDNVNATMTAPKRIVVMQFNLMEPTLVCAHRDLVEHVPVVSLVEAMEDALHHHHVVF